MNKITTQDGLEIDYKDWGAGEPVIFRHGRSLSAAACEDRMVHPVQRECYV